MQENEFACVREREKNTNRESKNRREGTRWLNGKEMGGFWLAAHIDFQMYLSIREHKMCHVCIKWTRNA